MNMTKPVLRILPLVASVMISVACAAQSDISLPRPDKSLKTTLVAALQNRHTERDFSVKEFSDKDLSTLLWAANGINRKDGKRTAPSAMNRQDIEIFVVRKDGAYFWNPQANVLERRSDKDLRPAVAKGQQFTEKAPLSLVLVSNGEKFGDMSNKFGLADAGYVSQNICLICSAEGWACCPRATMDTETLKKELGLSEKQVPMLNNVVGYGVKEK